LFVLSLAFGGVYNCQRRNKEDSDLSPEVQREVDTAYRRTLIIMLAVGASILLLLILNFLLSGRIGPKSDGDFTNLRLAFTAIVSFLALGSITLRRVMFQSMRLEIIWTTGGIKGLLQHLSKTSVLLAGITEAAAVLGLVFGIISGDSGSGTWLILVGLAVFLVAFPRRNSWLRVAAAAEAMG
jgi:hypothetical protein